MQRMKFLILLLLAFCACGAGIPTPGNPRPAARAAVDIAKDAWVLAANACIDATALTKDAKLGHACGGPLQIAHDLIVAAAVAVDTGWSPKAACDLAQATIIVTGVLPKLGNLAPDIAATVQDAAIFAKSMAASSACMPPGIMVDDPVPPDFSEPPAVEAAAPAVDGGANPPDAAPEAAE